MTVRPRQAAGTPAFVAEFGPAGSLRQDFGYGGRVHIDRPLPFIVLNRFDPDERDSLAYRIATTSPAYAAWPSPADDKAAIAALGAVTRTAAERFGSPLLITLYDLPRLAPTASDTPELPEFKAAIGASHDPAAQAAAARLAKAMEKVEIDLRQCEVERLPAPVPDPVVAELARKRGFPQLSLGLPRIYLTPDGDGVYPQLFRDLSVAVFDALLGSACAYMDKAGLGVPSHYRALGRSAFINAARTVDAKLDRICASFDFLLSVSPINTAQAFDGFRAARFRKPPEFRYRPLTVDPETAKRALYRIDLRTVEDPVLETLFAEKRQELDHQLTMLESRNTRRFKFASLMLYEPVDSTLRDTATAILNADLSCPSSEPAYADCHQVAEAARAMIERYEARDSRFDARIELRDDVAAGLMVTGRRLLISTDTRMPAHRVEPLLHHEVGVHLLTFFNGSKQGLRIFKRGLAGYEGVQEGLGVFAEWIVGGLTRVRLRLLAARVIAVDAMTDGAEFIELFRLLHRSHDFSAQAAFTIAARVMRSGGLAKDAIYLRGFKTVMDLLTSGGSLDPYWYGKIADRHLPVVAELAERGILARPALSPEFLNTAAARERVAEFRAAPDYAALI